MLQSEGKSPWKLLVLHSDSHGTNPHRSIANVFVYPQNKRPSTAIALASAPFVTALWTSASSPSNLHACIPQAGLLMCVMCDHEGTRCTCCLEIRYRSREFQRSDWPGHKLVCKVFSDFSDAHCPHTHAKRLLLFSEHGDLPRFVCVCQEPPANEVMISWALTKATQKTRLQYLYLKNTLAPRTVSSLKAVRWKSSALTQFFIAR